MTEPGDFSDHTIASGDYAGWPGFRLATLRRRLGTLLPYYLPLPASITARLYRWAGVKVKNPRKVFIGVGVWLDSSAPERISIGEHVIIGAGAKILTHSGPTFLQKARDWTRIGDVVIEDGALIGINAILLPGVTVGRLAVVGAGAVVAHSVPPRALVAGNPSRVIRILEDADKEGGPAC